MGVSIRYFCENCKNTGTVINCSGERDECGLCYKFQRWKLTASQEEIDAVHAAWEDAMWREDMRRYRERERFLKGLKK